MQAFHWIKANLKCFIARQYRRQVAIYIFHIFINTYLIIPGNKILCYLYHKKTVNLETSLNYTHHINTIRHNLRYRSGA